MTETGFAGIAPSMVLEGDIVTTIDGAGVPFLIRENKNRPDNFHLIGQCYIHGIMNGVGRRLKKSKAWIRLS